MPSPEPIAIVGMSCLLPKAQNLAEYWQNILAKRDCLTDVPDEHSWKVAEHYDADPSVPDKTYAKRGGFLDKFPFDPMEWGVTPSALDAIDTSQLLSLIVAREALKDAGIDPEASNWPRERTSCIIGVTGTQEMAVTLGARLQGPTWRKALKRHGLDDKLADSIVADIGQHFPEWQEQSFPGLLGNVVAGRITNRLDLGGTNCVVDAACASSLAAIQLAMGDLATGRADIALSGGVDALNDIFMYMCFSKTPAFSRSGDPKPFDAAADGILISEGIAMVVLKRLSDAERDGDRVYAVIRGIGSSSDGRYKSIYAPNGSGQAVALRRAYAEAQFPLESIELVEAHGTGTKAGDLAEVEALKQVFGASTREGRHVAIGTVKSQIGHTKSTAGAAGLLKAALALYHRVLPPTAKVETPNPKMGFDDSKLYLNTIARPWVRAKDHPRRAGVSAFGFGGSNFHLALEEHGDPDRSVPMGAPDEALFLFGGASAADVTAALGGVDRSALSLTHASQAVLQAWKPSAHVVAFTASSMTELAARLDAARALVASGPGERDGVQYGVPDASAKKLAVLFPGQGSQYVDMGRSLALRYATVRAALDRADDAMLRAGRSPLSERIYPPPAFDEAGRAAQLKGLTATEWAQPAIGAVSKGMWDLLHRFGIEADAFAGHSYGELVALCAAGVLDEESLWAASRVRGEAMADRGVDRGTMAAVSGDLAAIQRLLDGLGDGIVLANRNHPRQGVISGSREGIARAIVALGEAGLTAKEISVSAAFHSPLVADARAPFEAALALLPLKVGNTPVYADATAQPYPADPVEARALLARQIVSPVDFVGIVDALWESGVRTFVECGPKGVLAGLVRQCLKGRDGVSIVSVDRDEARVDGDSQLKRALATLAVRGAAVDVAPLLAEPLPPLAPKAGSKATVWLGGANYKKPSTLNPPPPVLPTRPPPVEPVRATSPGRQPAPEPTRAREQARGPALGPVPARPPAPMAPAPSLSPVSTAPFGGTPMSRPVPPAANAVPSSDLVALLETTRASLAAFQAAQERTALVHAEFLKTQGKANDSFTHLFGAHARLVDVFAGAPAAAYAPAPAAYAAPAYAPAPGSAPAAPAMSPLEAEVSQSLGSWYPSPDASDGFGRVADPAAQRRPAVAAESDLPPMLIPSHSGEPTVAAPAAAPAPVAKKSMSNVDSRDMVRLAMLATVAEKTGYPQDMLEFGMDLEADLGIDSIKRVEILSSVQERVPGLPELDNDRMSALRTLGEVVAYLQESSGGPLVAIAPPVAASRAVPHGGVDVRSAMLATVAEKTGYPVDMLEMGMDLEADLGIDSIKRVEILSAVQDRVPGLPELDNERMSALRTLGEVVGFLQEAGGGSSIVEAPTGAAVSSASDVSRAMLATVAEKTGYPVDMLEMGMDLEADLGIDSIKRVEILSAVQDRVPGLPELDNDRMSALRTLGEVVAFLQVAAGGPVETAPAPIAVAPVPAPLEAPAPSEAREGPTRRSLVVVPAPSGAAAPIPGPAVIFGGAFAADLGQALAASGVAVSVVGSLDAKGIAAALSPTVRTVVWAAAVDSEDAAAVRGAFLAARAGARDLFVTVSAQGGAFGFADRTDRVAGGALAGLAKTLGQEWSGRCLALDLAPTVDVAGVVAELARDRGVVEVGISPRGPVTLTTPESALVGSHTAPVAEGDVVVVSGGARGVTAAVALEMARRWRPHLVLLGRSPVADEPAWARGVANDALKAAYATFAKASKTKAAPKDLEAAASAVASAREIRANLDALRSAGARVDYVAVDVRDAAAVAAALARFHPVRGVVHGAGVIADKLAIEKPLASFDAVFGTKVDGLAALLGACPASELRMVGLFGSVAGRYGNRGQCDYAMGNEALAKAALDLRAAGVGRVRCFDWGPWEAGMVTPSLRKQLEARGHALIGLSAGAAAFCDELEAAGPGDAPIATEVVYGGPDGGPVLGDARPTGRSLRRLEATERFLHDHRIGGKPVLPVAMVLEWFARAARTAFPELNLAAIRDVSVMKGVVVDGAAAELAVDWREAASRPAGGGHTLTFELLGGPKLATVHYRATLEMSPEAQKSPRFPGSNGLGKERYPYAIDEAYRRFLFHGPMLQGIEGVVGISDHGMVGRVRTSLPEAFGEGGGWAMDPLVVDGALQLMLLWVREKCGTGALPCYVGEYRQLAPFQGAVTVHLEMERSTASSGRFHARFVADDGNVVATLTDGEYAASAALASTFHQAEA